MAAHFQFWDITAEFNFDMLVSYTRARWEHFLSIIQFRSEFTRIIPQHKNWISKFRHHCQSRWIHLPEQMDRFIGSEGGFLWSFFLLRMFDSTRVGWKLRKKRVRVTRRRRKWMKNYPKVAYLVYGTLPHWMTSIIFIVSFIVAIIYRFPKKDGTIILTESLDLMMFIFDKGNNVTKPISEYTINAYTLIKQILFWLSINLDRCPYNFPHLLHFEYLVSV